MADKPKKNRWAGKSTNLTKKQEKKAVRVVGTKGGKTRTEAVKKSERVASRKSVDIGQTKWMKASERKAAGQKGRGGLLVGTDGKPVTGTVTLPNGKKAQYVRGKRISAMPAKKTAAPRGGGGGGGGGGGTGSQGALSAAERTKLQQGRPNWQSGSTRTSAGPSAQQVAAAARQRRAMRRGPNAMYSAAGTRVSMSSTSPPKEGNRRTRIVNNRKVVEVYRNGKWLPLTGSRGGY